YISRVERSTQSLYPFSLALGQTATLLDDTTMYYARNQLPCPAGQLLRLSPLRDNAPAPLVSGLTQAIGSIAVSAAAARMAVATIDGCTGLATKIGVWSTNGFV